MNTLNYTIPNISCAHCTHTIEMEVSDLEGVESVTTELNDKSVVIEYSDPASEGKILSLLAEIYYPPSQA